MASAFIVGYSIGGMFPTFLQKDLHLTPALVALPLMLQSIVFFLSGSLWGWLAIASAGASQSSSPPC
jgi:SHS family lactate transporter-like MFS transporter